MGISEELEKLNERLDNLEEKKKKKPKEFKLPRSAKISNKQVKDNYVTVLYINDNKEWAFRKVRIDEGTGMIEGCPRVLTSEYMMTYKGKPSVIVPSWNSEPFSPASNYEEAVRLKMTSAGRRLLLNRLEMGQLKLKKKISGALIFFGVIALIVIGYLLLS